MGNEQKNRVGLAIVTGMKQFAGVGDGRKFEITPRGITFVGDMPFEQFEELLRGLKVVRDGYDLMLGTACRYGIAHYGKEKVEGALKQFEFEYQDGARAMALGQLELDFNQHEHLQSDHYWVLSQIEDSKEQQRWAVLAEKHKMTAILLKRSIEMGRVLKPEEVGESSGHGSGGLGFLEGLGMNFNQWQRRIGGKEALLQLDVDKRRRWLDSVKPILDLAHEVEDSLKQ